jgi:hypothetical protein
VVRRSTGTLTAACALSAALLVVAGCGGDGRKSTRAGGEVVLEPAAIQGPDPFTRSTATATATPPRVTRTPDTAPVTPGEGPRSYPGSTPGLYGGARQRGSCDVERQIGEFTADPGKARAFAEAAGVPHDSVPAFLRGLTSVVLRADTRVTNHGYRDGRAAGYQSVLQAGTPVLVDGRGVPRVRCACGNPLTPPREQRGTPAHRGTPWTGYRPAEAIVVTPAPQVVTHLTIIDVADNTWIERPTGHDTRHDKPVPHPDAGAGTPVPPSAKPVRPSPSISAPPEPAPEGHSTSPDEPPRKGHSAWPAEPSHAEPPGGRREGCATPTVTVTPGRASEADAPAPASCPPATATADPHTPTAESEPTGPQNSEPKSPPASSGGTGPDAVPDRPHVPDGGGPTPDATEAADIIFGSPTDVFLS